MMWPVDLRTSLWPQAGLAFDRSMADLLCHRSFFSCKDNTLNVCESNLSYNLEGRLLVRRSLLYLVERKHNTVRDQLCRLKPAGSRLWFSRTRVQHALACRWSSCLPASLNLVLTHPIERAKVGLHVIRSPIRLSATMPPASRVPPPPDEHRIGSRKRRTRWTKSSTIKNATTS